MLYFSYKEKNLQNTQQGKNKAYKRKNKSKESSLR